jgi:hypothetical protein
MKTRIFLTILAISLTFCVASGASRKNMNSSTLNYLEYASEQELTIENWMVNDLYWKCIENNCLAREWDHSLELEKWMTDGPEWEAALVTATEREEELVLENWMTDERVWKERNRGGENPDGELVLESWMTGTDFWK